MSSKDWRKDPKGAYDYVFLSHKWGNSKNAGKSYTRSYNKTAKQQSQ